MDRALDFTVDPAEFAGLADWVGGLQQGGYRSRLMVYQCRDLSLCPGM